MPYAILLNELIPLDLEKTARILARAENIIYADATRSVRNCCGILATGLPHHEAKAIAVDLNREGIGVFIMSQDEMYQPERTVTINNADCVEECFNVQDLYGRSHPLFWQNIILISLGRVVERRQTVTYRRSSPRTALRGGGIAAAALFGGALATPAPMDSSSVRKVTEEKHFLLDIFSKHPQKMHYRVQHNAFCYDYLGPRLKPSAAENFRVFVEDVVGYAREAYGNRGINAYLSGEDPKQLDYNDIDQFDKENLWLLQLLHLQSPASE